jgi:hypothetical protein
VRDRLLVTVGVDERPKLVQRKPTSLGEKAAQQLGPRLGVAGEAVDLDPVARRQDKPLGDVVPEIAKRARKLAGHEREALPHRDGRTLLVEPNDNDLHSFLEYTGGA